MKKYTLCILSAGVLWGMMGYFVRRLAGIGIPATGAVFIRCALAALLYGVTILIKDRTIFHIKAKDIWCFVGGGIFAMLFFTYCYFESMAYMDLSAAAILLYLAPIFVILLSRFIFQEKLTIVKCIAVVMAFAGCCLVSGLGGGGMKISLKGILLGLGAGFGYGLYSIFAQLAMKRGYQSLTVNFYTCLLASIGAGLVWGVRDTLTVMTASGANFLLCAAMAVITCYLPYMLYTYGLFGTETGKAAVMASTEPVVATIVGVIAFREKLTMLSSVGIILVLTAIVLVNIKREA